MIKKNILVTGTNGFLGSHVAKRLVTEHNVAGVGTSLEASVQGLSLYRKMSLPQTELVQLLEEFRPDAVIHCAGSASVPFSLKHPEADFQAGPSLVIHILEALRITHLRPTFIFPSSAAVYGNPAILPIREESPICPLSPYGHHKAMSEHIVREFETIYGIPHIILRIFSCYGVGLKKQLLWDVCQKIGSNDLKLHGTGEETRDFIHATDVARLIALCIEMNIKNATMNVASGEQTTVRRIATLLLNNMNSDLKLQFSGLTRPGDPLHWEADISRLKDMGFKHTIKLEEGVREYAEWVRPANP